MTRLPPDQIKPFILHADLDVRREALRYFTESHSADPTVMPLAIQSYETYRDPSARVGAYAMGELAQTADTVSWLLAASTAKEFARSGLASVLAGADIALLQAREAEVRRAVACDPTCATELSRRLELAGRDGDQLWQELAARCEAAEIEEAEYGKGWNEIEWVVEALGRQGDRHAERTLQILSRRFDPETLPTRDVWLVSAAVRLAGELRLPAAAPHIVAHMQHDWEMTDIESQRALILIGTDDVIRAIEDVYAPSERRENGFRIYSTGPLGHVHTDHALRTCLRLFDAEREYGQKDFLGVAVLEHFSVEGTQHILAAAAAEEVGGEVLYALPAVCTILGIESPVVEELRREEAERVAQRARQLAQWEADRAVMKANAARPPMRFASDLPPLSQPLSIQGKTAEAGRNDKCPCGSGKKYKKCCLGKKRV